MNACTRHFAVRYALLAGVLAVTFIGGAVHAATPKLVPAVWKVNRDASGFNWDIQQQGYVNRGTNNAFSGGMALTVNGGGFSVTSQMMTADGKEYILSGRANNVSVVRRIRASTDRIGARWVDTFSNPTGGPMSVQVLYQTSLNNQAQVVTDGGGQLGPRLGKKERGFIAVHQQNSYTSMMMAIAGPRAKVKPSITNQSNYRFRIQYALTIPAGESRSLVTGLGQSNIRALPANQKGRDALFKPFTDRRFLRGLPRDVLRSIVNWSGGGGIVSGKRPAVWTLAEDLDFEPDGTDVLAIGDSTRLKGQASWDELSIETVYGTAKLTKDKVAAIAGPRYLGGHSRVYLRDGQILAGKLAAKKLSFAMSAGNTVTVDPARIDRIVLRAQQNGPKVDPSVIAMVDTFKGDRLALVEPTKLSLNAITPWGTRALTLERLRWIAVRTEEQAGYEVVLNDGSRFFTLLDAESVPLESSMFGTIQVQATQVRYLSTEPGPNVEDDDEDFEMDKPYLLLDGEQMIVGKIAQEQIPLQTSVGPIPLSPGQVRTLKRNGSDMRPGEPVPFVAELWDGGTAEGAMAIQSLPVHVDDQTWHIPPSSIMEIVSPRPQLSDQDRAKVVNLIRMLGDTDWAKREKATDELGQMGALAAPMLRQAMRHTRDPEVRQRIEKLLEDLP